MTTLVKVNKNFQFTLLARLRERIPLREGDYLEAAVKKGKFIFTPTAIGKKTKQTKLD